MKYVFKCQKDIAQCLFNIYIYIFLYIAKRMQEPTSSLVHPIPEDIVIIEDDADDVAVENMVRSVQMDEDEAYARSLQVRLF